MTSSAGPPSDATRRAPATLLATLTASTFLVSGSGTAIAPFLLEISRDLAVELAAVANLIGIMSLPWGIMSLTAGTASDRVGRRPILTGAVLTLAASRIGLALAESYPAAVLWHVVTGLGGGAFMGTVFAAVSDHVPPAQRGRALGWVVTGQSLSLVFGTPLLTLIGAVGGWRGALAAQGAAVLTAALGVWLAVPRGPARPAGGPRSTTSLPRVLVPRVLFLLGAGTMERACFASATVYLATFLLTAYGVPMAQLALALALVALGNLAGNVLGGQVADRVADRPLACAAALVATGVLALPLLAWRPGVAVSVVLGFAYSLANAIGRPPLLAALSEVSSEARGAVFGLNITTGSFGWIGAAALGGWLVARFGFAALGAFCAAAGLLGAGLALASSRAGGGSRR